MSLFSRSDFRRGEVIRLVDWDLTSQVDKGDFFVLRDFNIVRVLEWHHRKVQRFATLDEFLNILLDRNVLIGADQPPTVELGLDLCTHTVVYLEELGNGNVDRTAR